MRKKGQAAMEFLMTYGWAILVAIAVIGILGYYYYDKSVLTPSSGVISPPFYLNAWSINTENVTIELKNNGGETYNVTSIALSNCGTNDTYFLLSAGSMEARKIHCTSALTAGETFKGDITVHYKKSSSSIELTSTGQLSDAVSAS